MPSEGPQKYVPTLEEIKKGEDTMTVEQNEFDDKREYSAEKLKEMGINGYLEPTLYVNGKMNIHGILNGHIVELSGYNNKVNKSMFDGASYKGTIDNQELSREEIESFFEKYEDTMVYRLEGEIIEAADVGGSKVRQNLREVAEEEKRVTDVKASRKRKILEDIGL